MLNPQELRSQILRDSDLISSRQRFGLFNHPLTTAVGDNGPYRPKLHPRNQTGKPETMPRNIQVSPNRSGQLSKSYFKPLNALAHHPSKHDRFIEEGIRLLKEDHQSFSKGRKEANFIPSIGINKSLAKGSYSYIEEKLPELDPKRYKRQDGRVRIGARNCVTNSDRKIADNLFKPYQHLEDPYDSEHKQELQRQKRAKAKQMEDAFRPNSFIPQLLNKQEKIYGSDVQFQMKKEKIYASSVKQHDQKWKSNNYEKSGRESMFMPIHPYIENPPAERTPRRELIGFRGMSPKLLSTPSPSISLNRVNMSKIINRSLSPRHR